MSIVSDPEGSATRGNLFECGCIRNRNVSEAFSLCDERIFFVMCHIHGTTCQRLQKSAKADFLFRMLLVKQHSKIGICFAYATKRKVIRMCHIRGTTCPTLKGRRREERLL